MKSTSVICWFTSSITFSALLVKIRRLYCFLSILPLLYFSFWTFYTLLPFRALKGRKKFSARLTLTFFDLFFFHIFTGPGEHYYMGNFLDCIIFWPSFRPVPMRIQYTVYNIPRSKQYYRTVRVTVPLVVYVLISTAIRYLPGKL